MGITLQFCDTDLKFHQYTLGTYYLASQHTGANLKRFVFQILNDFGVKPEDVCTITTDNAANFRKANDIFDKEADLKN